MYYYFYFILFFFNHKRHITYVLSTTWVKNSSPKKIMDLLQYIDSFQTYLYGFIIFNQVDRPSVNLAI